MTETPPPAAASGKKRAGAGGGRRGRKGRGGGERGGAASAAPAGPTPPAGDPPPPPASEAAPAVGDGSHGLAGATQSPLAVPGPLPGPGVDPGGSRPASSEPLGAAAAGTRDAPDDAAGVDARDAEAGAGEGPGAAAGAGDPEPPRRPAGPSLQQRLRRFWQTWIWRPAPAVERARRRRLAAGEAGSAGAATAEAAGDARPTLTGTVYLIPISHLDTQWRWTVRETVAQFLPQTVRDNAAAFLAYPSYKVNFDGAFRYRLLAEHHPEAFAEVKRWVAEGRWQVAGATWDALDVNLPGPEAFVRHVLYGRRWFREHLGRDPRDLFLPDCFGFGGHVPVLAAHCGLVGFATSKLRRGDDVRAAFGIPFPLGWWEGVDGSRVLALLEPGGYGEALAVAPGDDPEIEGQIRRHQASLDQGISVRFFGIGDKGGAPGQKSLERLEKAAGETAGVRTETVGSAEILERLAAELPADRLPTYRGELLLSVHGTGCYTSQAALKRWNARNERLAAAAESAAAAAAWLGAAPYPAEQLREAWRRFLWHQFHDDLTGTSIPAAYDISFHDEAIAGGALAEVLRASVAAIARGLDTRVTGVPVVVFNPLASGRRDLVSALVPWAGQETTVEVRGPDGEALPAQVEDAGRPGMRWVRFLADLPPLGFAVFDVRPGGPAFPADPQLRCSRGGLETGRWRMMLDSEGNLSSLWDRELDREMLGAPLRLELFPDRSTRFPAWEVQWEDLEPGAVAQVGGPAEVRTLASGPAAVSLEVRQRFRKSLFVTRYRLATGDAADTLEVELGVRWRARRRLLKATLTTAAAGRDAWYDAGVAGVRRGPSTAALYEVPAQSWADLTQDGNTFGVSVVTERPHGWDHPLPHVLRLTLLHTPWTGRRFPHQSYQDLGDHHFRFGIAGHRGDWRAGDVPALAARFRQPPLAFVVEPGGVGGPKNGPLGRTWSFLAVEGAEVAAVKQHEDGGELVVRLLDPTGRGGRAMLRLPVPVESARELDGTEDTRRGGAGESALTPMEPAVDGSLQLALTPHRPVAVGLRLGSPESPASPVRSAELPLLHDRVVVTAQGEPCPHGLDEGRSAIPAELFPPAVEAGGVAFTLAEAHPGRRQATACAGQRLDLPAGDWDRLWLLAASTGEAAVETALGTGDGQSVAVTVPPALAALARPDRVPRIGIGPVAWWRVEPGSSSAPPVAWVAGHCHDGEGRDQPYRPACLHVVSVPLPAGTRDVRLPDAAQVLLFAATVTAGGGGAVAAWGDEPLVF